MQKELPKFILDETFQPNSFQIANMKVIVKKVSCEKNASDIYQRY